MRGIRSLESSFSLTEATRDVQEVSQIVEFRGEIGSILNGIRVELGLALPDLNRRGNCVDCVRDLADFAVREGQFVLRAGELGERLRARGRARLNPIAERRKERERLLQQRFTQRFK